MIKIAIAAAAGNIGSRAARKISASGFTPVLMGRHTSKMERLNIPNAIIRETDLGNTEQVVNSTRGAEALLWLVPPVLHVSSLKNWYQKVIQAGLAAVKENKIKRVVLISSLGAGAAPNLGTITYTGDMEIAFDQLGDTNILALRPGYFMENFLTLTQQIKLESEFSFTYTPDHDIPFISTDDIGDAAAKYLVDSSRAGHWKLNLMGPENITLTEAASRISGLLDRPIRFKPISVETMSGLMGSFGANDRVQQEMAELFVALGDPNGAYATPRTPEAFTSTSFASFVKGKLLPLLNGA